MTDMKKMFTRLDFQAITTFILSGSEKIKFETGSYDERLERGQEAITNRLKSLYPNKNGFSDAYDDLLDAFWVYESVFMEMGIRLGAKLLYQLLIDDREGE